MFSTYNLSFENFKSRADLVLNQNKNLYFEKFCMRMAVIKADDKWKSALTIFTVYKKDHKINQKKNIFYSDFALLENWYDLKDFWTVLSSINARELLVDDLKVVFDEINQYWQVEFFTSNNIYSNIPIWSFYNQKNTQFQINSSEPVIEYSKPFHPGIYEAIAKWSEIKRVSDHNDKHFGSVTCVFPECVATITEMKQENKETLSIRITKDADSPELKLKGAWKFSGGYESFDVDIVESANLEIPKQYDNLQMYLVDSNNYVHDYFWGNIQGGTISNIEFTDEELIINALREGEGEKIEFKEGVWSIKAKISEVTKTVVSFSNTQGGTIIVGVNDDGEIRGVENDLSNMPEVDKTSEWRSKYIFRLRKKIKENVDEPLNLEIIDVVVQGKILVVIKVPKTEVPVSFNGTYYMRKNGSNFKASKEDLTRLFTTGSSTDDLRGYLGRKRL